MYSLKLNQNSINQTKFNYLKSMSLSSDKCKLDEELRPLPSANIIDFHDWVAG